MYSNIDLGYELKQLRISGGARRILFSCAQCACRQARRGIAGVWEMLHAGKTGQDRRARCAGKSSKQNRSGSIKRRKARQETGRKGDRMWVVPRGEK
jgi:hypothetical protein